MKNLESYIGKFVKIINGKHAGKYAYVETVHDWNGGALGVVSGDKDGWFECLVKPECVALLTSKEDIFAAKECACKFYAWNIKSLSEHYNNAIKAGRTAESVQYVIDLIVMRCNKYQSIDI